MGASLDLTEGRMDEEEKLIQLRETFRAGAACVQNGCSRKTSDRRHG